MAKNIGPTLFEEKPIRTGLRRRRPRVEPGKVLVLFRSGQPLVELRPGQTLTTGEAVWGKYEKAYEVDVSERPLSFECPLPAASGAFHFQASIQATYSVNQATAVVERRISDPVETVIKPQFLSLMRQVSQTFQIDESLQAEKAIREAIAQARFDMPFALHNVLVKLELDESTRRHLSEMQSARRKAELDRQQRVLEVKLSKDRIQSEAEIERERRVLEETQAELERERQKWQLERQRLEAENEMKLQQMRLEFYKPLVMQGNWSMLALQLAEKPQDVAQVAQIMRQMHDQEIAYRVRILETALDKDALETFHLDEAMEAVLRDLVTMFRMGGPPSLAAPQEPRAGLPEGERPSAEPQEAPAGIGSAGEEATEP